MKKLNEEWRSKVKGIFESATVDTIFEMPETDLEVSDTEVPDLGMGAEVTPIEGETITLTKDALRELLMAVKSEEDVEDEEGLDDIEGEEGLDDTSEIAPEVEEPIDETPVPEVVAEEEPEIPEVDDENSPEVDDMNDVDSEVSEFGDEMEDEEDDEITSIVDKAFELAAGGTLDASQVPEIVANIGDEMEGGEEPEFPELDDEESEEVVPEEPVM